MLCQQNKTIKMGSNL